MQPQEPSALTDQALNDELQSIQPSPITHALLIGFLFGIILFSIWKSSIGLFTLVPLYFIYRLIYRSKRRLALEAEYKARQSS